MKRYFNAWVGTYQVVFGLLTIPLVFVPILCGRKDGPISPSEFPLYVAHGMQCFLGTSPEPEAGGVASHCRNAPPVFAFHLLLSVIFNMFLMLTLKYGSATLAMVASAVQVAFSVFAFQISFIAGKATRTVRPLDIVALVVLVMGLFVYQYRPEIRDRPSLTATRAVARMVHATPRGAADDFITGQQFVEAETNGLDGAKKQV